MKRILIYSLLILSITSFAQPPVKFLTRFGGNGIDVGYSVKQSLDGHYIVTGSTSSFGFGNTDVLLSKIDSMGWVRWEKTFGGFNNDIGKSIILLADSGFVIAGYTNSFGAGGYDVYVVRTDKNGNLKWQKSFGGTDWDFGYDVVQAPDGHIVICGSTFSYGYGKNDGFVIKADSANGNLIWKKTFGGAEDDEFKSLLITYNSKIALAGTTKSLGDVKGDAWLFKLELNGDSIMSFKHGNNRAQFINDITENTESNELILCGGNDFDGRDSSYAYLLGLSEIGIFAYEHSYSYHNMKDAQFQSVNFIKNNKFFYVRKQYNSTLNLGLEPMLMITDPEWDQVTRTVGSLADDELFGASKTRDKGFISVGYTKGLNANQTDVFLVKFDSTITNSNLFSIVGINEIEEKRNNYPLIYPTITNGKITILTNNKKGVSQINIYNSLGQLVLSKKVNTDNSEIDLIGFSAGMYNVTIVNQLSLENFKIVKID